MIFTLPIVTRWMIPGGLRRSSTIPYAPNIDEQQSPTTPVEISCKQSKASRRGWRLKVKPLQVSIRISRRGMWCNWVNLSLGWTSTEWIWLLRFVCHIRVIAGGRAAVIKSLNLHTLTCVHAWREDVGYWASEVRGVFRWRWGTTSRRRGVVSPKIGGCPFNLWGIKIVIISMVVLMMMLMISGPGVFPCFATVCYSWLYR